jgi:precorrin-2 dehydrogenase/sirohydrochlorin ferrochelatase
MLPLMLDPRRLRLLLIGDGAAALRRLELLDEAGASDLAVHAPHPQPSLARAAGPRLVARLPEAAELAAARLVFISERDAPYAEALAAEARSAGALVHVEDAPDLSEVQAPAVLRRGDLVIAVSTGGASPGLAVAVKRFLGHVFGPEWRDHLDAVAALRRGWRDAGADGERVAQWTASWLGRQGWLPAASEHDAAPPEPLASLPRKTARR